MKTQVSKNRLLMRMILLAISVAVTLSFTACGTKTETEPTLWDNAVYKENTELGTGSITVQVEVAVEDNSVIFTIHTDKETLGEALLENDLIKGEDSEYGLYITEVNGIVADYDVDQAYWGFFMDGEFMMTGVDATSIADGDHYELVYTLS